MGNFRENVCWRVGGVGCWVGKICSGLVSTFFGVGVAGCGPRP